MFNRFCRISQLAKIFSVITMSALLLWATSGMSVVSQQVQMPTRNQIVQGLRAKVAALTAAEGDIFDIENTAFYSDPGVFSLAFIPLHPSSRSLQLIPKLVEEDIGAVTFGVLYLEGDWPDTDLPLKAGIYTLKLKSDHSVVAVAEDEEFQICAGSWRLLPAPVFSTPVPPITEFSFSYQPEPSTSTGTPMLESLNILTALAFILVSTERDDAYERMPYERSAWYSVACSMYAEYSIIYGDDRCLWAVFANNDYTNHLIFSAALWLWVALHHMRKRAALESTSSLRQLNFVIGAAFVIVIATLTTAGIAIICAIQGSK